MNAYDLFHDIADPSNVRITTLTSNGNPLYWREDLGIGYLPSRGYDYGEMYWQNYLSYNTDKGSVANRLNDYRKNFVMSKIPAQYVHSNLCDVGIGSGQFVEEMQCHGYDVNTYAKAWLENWGLWGDPYKKDYKILTFWDVLEHIDDPSKILSKPLHVFTSLPIFEDLDHVMRSKHLKPDEHIWYFTDAGIKHFMGLHEFVCVDSGDGETKIGREGILSYYFQRG